MINLNNYETWFMLYADNELSAEEQRHVLQFVQEHPELQEELDGLLELKMIPDEGMVFPKKHVLKEDHLLEQEIGIFFEPDFTVVYPNKQELYRKGASTVNMWLRPLQVAAVLLIGLFWFINRPANDVKPLAAGNSGESIKKPTLTIEKSSPVSDIVVVNHHPSKSSNQHSMFVPAVEVSSTDEMVSTEENNKVNEEQVIAQEINSTKLLSNFTEEAVKAGAARTLTEPVATAMNTEQPAVQSFEEPTRSKKLPLRGLLRKITRTVLNEEEENDGRNYVHVASFSIPVSKTNNK